MAFGEGVLEMDSWILKEGGNTLTSKSSNYFK